VRQYTVQVLRDDGHVISQVDLFCDDVDLSTASRRLLSSRPSGTHARQRALAHMRKKWTEDDTEKLKRLRQIGASAARAAVALKWSKTVVKEKAREFGIPFPSWRAQRSEQRAKEVVARAKAGLPEKP
jgi:hypothetical protein